jgi:putative copper export protein
MMEALALPLLRWALFSGVLLLVGVVSWRGAVVPRLRPHLGQAYPPQEYPEILRLERRMAGAGILLALFLLPVWGLRLWSQLQEFRDPFVPLSEDVDFLLRQTFWGKVWIAQGATLLLLVGGFLLLRGPWGGSPPPSPGLTPEGIPREGPRLLEWPWPWRVVAGLVGFLALSLSLSSHAMSVPVNTAMAVGVDAGHLMAAGAWMGTLALILAVTPGKNTDVPLLGIQLRAFSPLAMGAVGVLVFLGVILSGLHVHEWSVLWREAYGRTLSLKVLASLGVMGMGFVNWRKGLPRVDTPGGRRWVRRTAWLEVAGAAVVILLTALLVATPLPPGAH